MNVSIVIPNWNGKELLQKHLPAVLRAAGRSEVIVVDDASTDDSARLLQHTFPRVKVIQKDRHEGFASTVNVGASRAAGEVVVLLNSDCEPEKDFIQKLLVHFDDPNVFAVACMDKSIEGGRVTLRGRGIAKWRRGYFIHERGEVDTTTTAWVSGGSGAFRKSVWQKLGGMDELFDPFYWEDIDLSYRALKAGYRLVFEPKSVVKHFHEEGNIVRTYSRSFVQTIAYRNQFQFIWKNVSDVNIVISHCLWTPVFMLRALSRLDFPFLMGYIRAILRLPNIVRHRVQSFSMWQKPDHELLQNLS